MVKREATRDRVLPAFSLTLDELEILWGRMLHVLNFSETGHTGIEIKLPRERLEFNSATDLKTYGGLPARFTKFTLYGFDQEKRLRINTDSLMGRPYVTGTSPDDVWCATAVEAVLEFIQSHRIWYWWISRRLIAICFFVVLFVPLVLTPFANNNIQELPWHSKAFVFGLGGWALLAGSLGYASIFQERLFLQSIIKVSEEENNLRRYSTEIVVIGTLLSVVFAAVAALFTVLGYYK